MKNNMSNTDRLIRVLLAILFVALYFTGTIPGTPGLILVIVGGVFLATAIVGFCPLYRVFGICSKKPC